MYIFIKNMRKILRKLRINNAMWYDFQISTKNPKEDQINYAMNKNKVKFNIKGMEERKMSVIFMKLTIINYNYIKQK